MRIYKLISIIITISILIQDIAWASPGISTLHPKSAISDQGFRKGFMGAYTSRVLTDEDRGRVRSFMADVTDPRVREVVGDIFGLDLSNIPESPAMENIDIKNIITDIVKMLLENPELKEEIEAIYLFGSVATGTANGSSDIDLFVRFKGLPRLERRFTPRDEAFYERIQRLDEQVQRIRRECQDRYDINIDIYYNAISHPEIAMESEIDWDIAIRFEEGQLDRILIWQDKQVTRKPASEIIVETGAIRIDEAKEREILKLIRNIQEVEYRVRLVDGKVQEVVLISANIPEEYESQLKGLMQERLEDAFNKLLERENFLPRLEKAPQDIIVRFHTQTTEEGQMRLGRIPEFLPHNTQGLVELHPLALLSGLLLQYGLRHELDHAWHVYPIGIEVDLPLEEGRVIMNDRSFFGTLTKKEEQEELLSHLSPENLNGVDIGGKVYKELYKIYSRPREKPDEKFSFQPKEPTVVFNRKGHRFAYRYIDEDNPIEMVLGNQMIRIIKSDSELIFLTSHLNDMSQPVVEFKVDTDRTIKIGRRKMAVGIVRDEEGREIGHEAVVNDIDLPDSNGIVSRRHIKLTIENIKGKRTRIIFEDLTSKSGSTLYAYGQAIISVQPKILMGVVEKEEDALTLKKKEMNKIVKQLNFRIGLSEEGWQDRVREEFIKERDRLMQGLTGDERRNFEEEYSDRFLNIWVENLEAFKEYILFLREMKINLVIRRKDEITDTFRQLVQRQVKMLRRIPIGLLAKAREFFPYVISEEQVEMKKDSRLLGFKKRGTHGTVMLRNEGFRGSTVFSRGSLGGSRGMSVVLSAEELGEEEEGRRSEMAVSPETTCAHELYHHLHLEEDSLPVRDFIEMLKIAERRYWWHSSMFKTQKTGHASDIVRIIEEALAQDEEKGKEAMLTVCQEFFMLHSTFYTPAEVVSFCLSHDIGAEKELGSQRFHQIRQIGYRRMLRSEKPVANRQIPLYEIYTFRENRHWIDYGDEKGNILIYGNSVIRNDTHKLGEDDRRVIEEAVKYKFVKTICRDPALGSALKCYINLLAGVIKEQETQVFFMDDMEVVLGSVENREQIFKIHRYINDAIYTAGYQISFRDRYEILNRLFKDFNPPPSVDSRSRLGGVLAAIVFAVSLFSHNIALAIYPPPSRPPVTLKELVRTRQLNPEAKLRVAWDIIRDVEPGIHDRYSKVPVELDPGLVDAIAATNAGEMNVPPRIKVSVPWMEGRLDRKEPKTALYLAMVLRHEIQHIIDTEGATNIFKWWLAMHKLMFGGEERAFDKEQELLDIYDRKYNLGIDRSLYQRYDILIDSRYQLGYFWTKIFLLGIDLFILGTIFWGIWRVFLRKRFGEKVEELKERLIDWLEKDDSDFTGDIWTWLQRFYARIVGSTPAEKVRWSSIIFTIGLIIIFLGSPGILFKILTTMVLLSLGDFFAQLVEGKSIKALDRWRLTYMAILGCLYAVIWHFYYNGLEMLFPGSAFLTAVIPKILIDQTFFTAPFNLLNFFMIALFTGRLSEYKSTIKKHFRTAIITNWAFWIPAHLVNFLYIPLEYRVLYVGLISLIWNPILSMIGHGEWKGWLKRILSRLGKGSLRPGGFIFLIIALILACVHPIQRAPAAGKKEYVTEVVPGYIQTITEGVKNYKKMSSGELIEFLKLLFAKRGVLIKSEIMVDLVIAECLLVLSEKTGDLTPEQIDTASEILIRGHYFVLGLWFSRALEYHRNVHDFLTGLSPEQAGRQIRILREELIALLTRRYPGRMRHTVVLLWDLYNLFFISPEEDIKQNMDVLISILDDTGVGPGSLELAAESLDIIRMRTGGLGDYSYLAAIAVTNALHSIVLDETRSEKDRYYGYVTIIILNNLINGIMPSLDEAQRREIAERLRYALSRINIENDLARLAKASIMVALSRYAPDAPECSRERIVEMFLLFVDRWDYKWLEARIETSFNRRRIDLFNLLEAVIYYHYQSIDRDETQRIMSPHVIDKMLVGDILRIFFHPEFQRIVCRASCGPGLIWSWLIGVRENLIRLGLNLKNSRHISWVLNLMKAELEDDLEREFLGPGINTLIIIANEEKSFNPDIDKALAISHGVKPENIHIIKGAKDPEINNRAKEQVNGLLETSPGPLSIWFNGHGRADRFILGDNDHILVEDLSRALFNRVVNGNGLKDVIIFTEACFGYNFTTVLYNRLHMKLTAENSLRSIDGKPLLPLDMPLVITLGHRGKVTLIGVSNFVLRQLRPFTPVTVGGILDLTNIPHVFKYQDGVLFIPVEPDRYRKEMRSKRIRLYGGAEVPVIIGPLSGSRSKESFDAGTKEIAEEIGLPRMRIVREGVGNPGRYGADGVYNRAEKGGLESADRFRDLVSDAFRDVMQRNAGKFLKGGHTYQELDGYDCWVVDIGLKEADAYFGSSRKRVYISRQILEMMVSNYSGQELMKTVEYIIEHEFLESLRDTDGRDLYFHNDVVRVLEGYYGRELYPDLMGKIRRWVDYNLFIRYWNENFVRPKKRNFFHAMVNGLAYVGEFYKKDIKIRMYPEEDGVVGVLIIDSQPKLSIRYTSQEGIRLYTLPEETLVERSGREYNWDWLEERFSLKRIRKILSLDKAVRKVVSLRRIYEGYIEKLGITPEDERRLRSNLATASYCCVIKNKTPYDVIDIYLKALGTSKEGLDLDTKKQLIIATYEVAMTGNHESLKRVIRQYSAVLGKDIPERLRLKWIIATYEVAMKGRHESLKKVIRLYRAVLGKEIPEELKEQWLTATYKVAMKGNHESLKSVIRQYRTVLGKDIPDRLRAKWLISTYEVAMNGQHESLRRVIRLYKSVLGRDIPDGLKSHWLTATYVSAMYGRHESLKKVIRLYRPVLGKSIPEELKAKWLIATSHVAARGKQESLKKVIRLYSKALGGIIPDELKGIWLTATYRIARNDNDISLKEVIKIYRSVLGEVIPDRLKRKWLIATYAVAAKGEQGSLKEVIRLYRKVLGTIPDGLKGQWLTATYDVAKNGNHRSLEKVIRLYESVLGTNIPDELKGKWLTAASRVAMDGNHNLLEEVIRQYRLVLGETIPSGLSEKWLIATYIVVINGKPELLKEILLALKGHGIFNTDDLVLKGAILIITSLIVQLPDPIAEVRRFIGSFIGITDIAKRKKAITDYRRGLYKRVVLRIADSDVVISSERTKKGHAEYHRQGMFKEVIRQIAMELGLTADNNGRYDLRKAGNQINTSHGELRIEPDGILVIIDSRFKKDHAGRRQMAVYARSEQKARHELAELRAWIGYAKTKLGMSEEDIRQGRLNRWMQDKRNEEEVEQLRRDFHRLGVEAEGIPNELVYDIKGGVISHTPIRDYIGEDLVNQFLSFLSQGRIDPQRSIETLVILRSFLRYVIDTNRRLGSRRKYYRGQYGRLEAVYREIRGKIPIEPDYRGKLIGDVELILRDMRRITLEALLTRILYRAISKFEMLTAGDPEISGILGLISPFKVRFVTNSSSPVNFNERERIMELNLFAFSWDTIKGMVIHKRMLVSQLRRVIAGMLLNEILPVDEKGISKDILVNILLILLDEKRLLRFSYPLYIRQLRFFGLRRYALLIWRLRHTARLGEKIRHIYLYLTGKIDSDILPEKEQQTLKTMQKFIIRNKGILERIKVKAKENKVGKIAQEHLRIVERPGIYSGCLEDIPKSLWDIPLYVCIILGLSILSLVSYLSLEPIRPKVEEEPLPSIVSPPVREELRLQPESFEHTVIPSKPDDCLAHIARKYYGVTSRRIEGCIAEYNNRNNPRYKIKDIDIVMDGKEIILPYRILHKVRGKNVKLSQVARMYNVSEGYLRTMNPHISLDGRLQRGDEIEIAVRIEPTYIVHAEGFRLKNGRAGLWVNGEDISIGDGIDRRKENIRTAKKNEPDYIIAGKKIYISNELIARLRDTDISWLDGLLAEGFKDSLPIKDEIFIDLLNDSLHLFEDCKENGYIGINEQLFRIQDPGLRVKLLKVGIAHELKHEAGSTKTESELLTEDVIESVKVGIGDKDMQDLAKGGILEEDCGFFKLREVLDTLWEINISNNDLRDKADLIVSLYKDYPDKKKVLEMIREYVLIPAQGIQNEWYRDLVLSDIYKAIAVLYQNEKDRSVALDVIEREALGIRDKRFRASTLASIKEPPMEVRGSQDESYALEAYSHITKRMLYIRDVPDIALADFVFGIDSILSVLALLDSFDHFEFEVLPLDISTAYSLSNNPFLRLRSSYLKRRVVEDRYSLRERVRALLLNHSNEIVSYTTDVVKRYGDSIGKYMGWGNRYIMGGLLFLETKIGKKGYRVSELIRELGISGLRKQDIVRILKEMGYGIDRGYIVTPINLVTSVYRGSAEIDHAGSRYVTHSITTALCHYARMGGEATRDREEKVVVIGNKALHEVDYALMCYEGVNTRTADENVALAFSYAGALPQYSRKRTVVIESKSTLAGLEEIREKQERERFYEANILRLLMRIANGEINRESIDNAIAGLKEQIEGLREIVNEYYFLALYGYLDDELYNQLGNQYKAGQKNIGLLKGLTRIAQVRQLEELTKRKDPPARYDEFLGDIRKRNVLWGHKGLNLLGYLEFKEKMRKGTYEERDVEGHFPTWQLAGLLDNLGDSAESFRLREAFIKLIKEDGEITQEELEILVKHIENVMVAIDHLIGITSDEEKKEAIIRIALYLSIEEIRRVKELEKRPKGDMRRYFYQRIEVAGRLGISPQEIESISPSSTDVAVVINKYFRDKKERQEVAGKVVDVVTRYLLNQLEVDKKTKDSIERIIRSKNIEILTPLPIVVEVSGKIILQDLSVYLSDNPDWDRENLDNMAVGVIRDLTKGNQQVMAYTDKTQKERFIRLLEEKGVTGLQDRLAFVDISQCNSYGDIKRKVTERLGLSIDELNPRLISLVKVLDKRFESEDSRDRIIIAGHGGLVDIHLMWRVALILLQSEGDIRSSLMDFLKEYYKGTEYEGEVSDLVEEMFRHSIYIVLPPIVPFIKNYYDALDDAQAVDRSA